MKTAFTTATNTIKGDALDMIEVALPAGLAIMGISLVIGIAIKVFKKLSSK